MTGWQAGRVGAKLWLRTVMSQSLSLRSHKEKRSDSCKLCPDLSTNAWRTRALTPTFFLSLIWLNQDKLHSGPPREARFGRRVK